MNWLGSKKLALPQDPRIFQIIALSCLLAFCLTARSFEIPFTNILAIFVATLATQWLGSLINAIPFDPKSPLITALSLTLLLRADNPWPLALAATIAIGSKFTLRLNGKHLFNPANAGIVFMLLIFDAAWTTPGQWGTAMWFAGLLAGIGFFITYRAARLDVPLVFLTIFALLLFGRAIWLGDPITIPLLRLQNGALILFAFFMISDPMTTPDGRIARALFAASTALAAFIFTFNFHLSDGIFYALALICFIRPLIEFFDPAPAYRWVTPSLPKHSTQQDTTLAE